MGMYDGSVCNAYLGSNEDQAQREMQPELKEAIFWKRDGSSFRP